MRTMLLFVLSASALHAQDDPRDLRAGDDEKKRYYLHGSTKAADKPKAGFGLIVILPGGNGSDEFRKFVSSVEEKAVPGGYIVAQPVAVKWKDDQEIVWPTAKNTVEGAKFTTEEFIAAVIEDVGKRNGIDPKRIFLMGWSSSGPAVYATMLGETKACGAIVAMSVFKPDLLPDLAKSKGKPFYIHHSKEDKVCPFRMAEQAVKELKEAGATVKLSKYEGGHGWQGDPFTEIRAGIEWLQEPKEK